jgi:hypothetical protein
VYALVACGCYTPSPHEGLECSETDGCPSGQSCDPAFHECFAFPGCATPPITDAFDGPGDPCQGWGRQFGNAIVEQRGGAVFITPNASGDNSGGCESIRSIPFVNGGIFIEVPGVMAAGHGFVLFSARGIASPTIRFEDNQLSLTWIDGTVASRSYDPVAMRWWRLRPEHGGARVIGEYAADGYHWTQLGAVPDAPEPAINIEFEAGSGRVDASPGTAQLAHLDLCPPRG